MEQNPAAATAAPQDRVRKEETFQPIVVSRVYTSKYQKEGTVTAELKQTVDTKSFYPSKSVTSDLQDNPFSTEEFGFSEQEYDASSTRVAWIDVPATLSHEEVEARIKALPNARLYRILSNKPILSDRQQYAVEAGTTTLEVIAESQAVRYPANHATHPGKLIMDTNGKPQFKGVFFKSTMSPDVEKRTEDVNDFYATPLMVEEMTGVINQSLSTI
jgi:hypothetical protein